MEDVSTWKVIGMRGLNVVETLVFARSENEARIAARDTMGFWLILRTVEVGVVRVW